MDPFLNKVIEAGFTERMAALQIDSNAAQARARDTALHGLKVIEGVVSKELLVSDDLSETMRGNLAARSPSTLDHPNAVVSK